jgi:hypothetical protein
MSADEDDSMQRIISMAAQLLPAIILNSEAKVWSDLVLVFVRAGDGTDTAVEKADRILTEHRSRFGSAMTKEALFDGAPKADLRAIR